MGTLVTSTTMYVIRWIIVLLVGGASVAITGYLLYLIIRLLRACIMALETYVQANRDK